MKLHGFLDHLLRSAGTSSGAPSAPAPAQAGNPLGNLGGMLNGDFGRGALSGGALGLLLGSNRTTRKLATYGGLAAIGMMAYRAYGDYQRQQTGQSIEPQTVDRLPPPQAELHSEAILRALVAAAKADGHVDARERELIEGEFSRVEPDRELRQWLHAELEKPLDPAEVAGASASPEIAAEMYLASLLVVDEQSFMERAYLDELARRLGIDDVLKAKLEAQVRTPA